MIDDEKLYQRIKYEAVGAFNSHFVVPFQHEGSWYVERMALIGNAYYLAVIDEEGITFLDVPDPRKLSQDRGRVD